MARLFGENVLMEWNLEDGMRPECTQLGDGMMALPLDLADLVVRHSGGGGRGGYTGPFRPRRPGQFSTLAAASPTCSAGRSSPAGFGGPGFVDGGLPTDMATRWP
ncbi:hypothetical protein ACVBEG_26885 [Pseudomonas sp. GG8]